MNSFITNKYFQIKQNMQFPSCLEQSEGLWLRLLVRSRWVLEAALRQLQRKRTPQTHLAFVVMLSNLLAE